MNDETRECEHCGEESKPITEVDKPTLVRVRCPLCGGRSEIPRNTFTQPDR